MIKILVVDSVRLQRESLCDLFAAHGQMQVVATAENCDQALELIERLRPNIAVIGHQLPKLDGLEVTQRAMERCPLPIVVVTGTGSPGEVASSFDAVGAGALAVLPRPPIDPGASLSAAARELLQTIRVMSEVKVVRRWPKRQANTPSAALNAPPQAQGSLQVVAIGASTGGPMALATLLAGLPRNFVAPVVVVQHMAAGFMRGFVDWLAPSSALPIHIATHGEHMHPGHVYVAPDGVHMEVAHRNKIQLVAGPVEHGVQPSVAHLFRSVAQTYGSRAAAVLLTGMGRDGASELLCLKEQGALTFAQDKESSIVHGMPGEAINLGAASRILPPADIASVLAKLSDAQRTGGKA